MKNHVKELLKNTIILSVSTGIGLIIGEQIQTLTSDTDNL